MGRTLGQFRVVVTDALIPGQPVRAGTGGAEFLVRVPENAKPGDSFVFSVTEEDLQAMKDPPSEAAHIIELVVLEKKKTLTEKVSSILPQFRADLETQVLFDFHRTTFLAIVFSISLCFGFIGGVLLYTWDYWNGPDATCSKEEAPQQ